MTRFGMALALSAESGIVQSSTRTTLLFRAQQQRPQSPHGQAAAHASDRSCQTGPGFIPPIRKVQTMSAPKKAPAKAAPKHDDGKDLRRAHEHQSRVEALRSAVGKHTTDIDTLTKLGEQELSDSHYKDAADLFRAAEHLSFGFLVSSKPAAHPDEKLAKSSQAEFESKLDKADEHWEDNEALAGIYKKVLADAKQAFEEGAHFKALELVRAAEALAHVHLHDSKTATAA